MTVLRLTFAGQIKKAEWKNAAGKSLIELSICRKNKVKDGEAESWTWVRVTVWEPAEFQAPKLAVGCYIAGSGEMVLRSYTGKDGSKGTSCEVSCRSFDVEAMGGGEAAPAAAVQPAPAAAPRVPKPAAAPVASDDEPPF